MRASLTIDGLRLVSRYDTARSAVAMWSEEKDLVRDELVAAMGEAESGFYMGVHVLKITRSRPSRFNMAAFREDHPDLYGRYSSEPEADEVRLWIPKKLPIVPTSADRFYDRAGVAE